MQASDIMSTVIVALKPDATLDEAALIMTSQGFTTLPVVDSYGHLLGLLSENELIRARTEHTEIPKSISDHDPQKRTSPKIDTIMRTPAIGIDPHCELTALANTMIEKSLRSLPVVRDGQVIGIVTFQDLLRTLSSTKPHEDAGRVHS